MSNPTGQPIIGLSDEEVYIIAAASMSRWCGEKFDTILSDRHDAPWLTGYTEVMESIADQLEDYIVVGLRRTQVNRAVCKNCAHDMLDHTSRGVNPDPDAMNNFIDNPCDIEIVTLSGLNPEGEARTVLCGCLGFVPTD